MEWTRLRTLERNGNQLAIGERQIGERQRRASEEWTSQRRYHWTTGENHNSDHTRYQEYPAAVQMNRIRHTPERLIPKAPSSTNSFNQRGYSERPVRDRISYRQNERGRSGAQSAKLTYCSGSMVLTKSHSNLGLPDAPRNNRDRPNVPNYARPYSRHRRQQSLQDYHRPNRIGFLPR